MRAPSRSSRARKADGHWPATNFVSTSISAPTTFPPARLAIGNAVIEVSAVPHTGCGKFVERFGVDAMKFVNGTIGRQLNLRGINVQSGTIRVGDTVIKT